MLPWDILSDLYFYCSDYDMRWMINWSSMLVAIWVFSCLILPWNFTARKSVSMSSGHLATLSSYALRLRHLVLGRKVMTNLDTPTSYLGIRRTQKAPLPYDGLRRHIDLCIFTPTWFVPCSCILSFGSQNQLEVWLARLWWKLSKKTTKAAEELKGLHPSFYSGGRLSPSPTSSPLEFACWKLSLTFSDNGS